MLTSFEAEPKPSLDGYIELIKRLGVDPSEALYIGDRPLVELRPAKELGLRTMQIGGQKSAWADYYAEDIEDAMRSIIQMINNSR